MATSVTPEAPAAPQAPESFTNALNRVAAKTSIPAPPPVDTTVVQFQKNTTPAEPSLVPGSVPTAPATPPTDPTTPPVDAAPPETPVAETPPSDTTTPDPSGELALEDDGITLRAERNADGTFKTKLDPSIKLDLEFKDKESGETRKYTKTLPDILRLAKDGVALQPIVQQLKPKVEYYEKMLPQWKQDHEATQQQLQDQMALNRELLAAPPDVLEQRRQEYAQEMSPEKRLARLEAERRAEQETAHRTAQQQQLANRARAFHQEYIAPHIAEAVALLGDELVTGKLAMATAPLLVNGQMPPSAWPEYKQYVHGPFKDWVKSQAATRKTADDVAAKARAEADAAQKKAQAAINDTTRALAPVGRVAADTPPPLPKPKNTTEAIQRMLNRPLPTSAQSTATTG